MPGYRLVRHPPSARWSRSTPAWPGVPGFDSPAAAI